MVESRSECKVFHLLPQTIFFSLLLLFLFIRASVEFLNVGDRYVGNLYFILLFVYPFIYFSRYALLLIHYLRLLMRVVFIFVIYFLLIGDIRLQTLLCVE